MCAQALKQVGAICSPNPIVGSCERTDVLVTCRLRRGAVRFGVRWPHRTGGRESGIASSLQASCRLDPDRDTGRRNYFGNRVHVAPELRCQPGCQPGVRRVLFGRVLVVQPRRTCPSHKGPGCGKPARRSLPRAHRARLRTVWAGRPSPDGLPRYGGTPLLSRPELVSRLGRSARTPSTPGGC